MYHAALRKKGGKPDLAHLTDQRIEFMAEARAKGKLRSRATREYLCSMLSCTDADLERWAHDGRVTKRAMEVFQARVFDSIVKYWPAAEKELKKGKLQAFRLGSQICTLVPVGGVSFQQNQFIDARVSGQLESTKQFAKNFWDRVRSSNPLLQLVEANPTEVTVHDPPNDEPKPDNDEPAGGPAPEA